MHAVRKSVTGPLLCWAAILAVGVLWFVLATDSAAYGVPSVAAVAVVGVSWQSVARTRKRLVVLDAYANREIARTTKRGAGRRMERSAS